MAVVQISRIQQRRGKKNSATGFPQLASGEIGWAIDTQELYIGNGSVSEGSPYVGNTQILTEHVNILEFAEAYQYKRNDPTIRTGPTSLTPIQRTIQERLDDRVSVRSFGAKGNGVDDDTNAIQRALDQLFLNESTKNNETNRYILYFEPGVYVVSEELKIPPYAHLSGAGIDSTKIHMTGTGASGRLMRMVAGNSVGNGSYVPFESMSHLERPRFIFIEKMTLKTEMEDSIVLLDNTDSSIFYQVKFEANYVNGTSPPGAGIGDSIIQTAIYSRSASGIFRPDNVQFHSCVFEKTGWGFYSKSDHDNISFINCKFNRLFEGISMGGEIYGAVNTLVDGCYFDLIDRAGLHIKKGSGNTSSNNKYMNVGNNNRNYVDPEYPIVIFDTPNNQSSNDYFERNTKLKKEINNAAPFYPNVRTTGLIVDPTNYSRVVITTPVAPVDFLRFPIWTSSTYFIDYVIKQLDNPDLPNAPPTAVRTGRIHITVDFPNELYHIQDDFSYIGNSTVENIEFSASLENFDNTAPQLNETLIVKLLNPTGNRTGIMNYSYRMLTESNIYSNSNEPIFGSQEFSDFP